MTERQKALLKQLIESYVDTAEPVASAFLAQKQSVSSATVRNDMAALEKEGLILQPHTSAGRIPTEAGYRFYLGEYLSPKQPSSSQKSRLAHAAKSDDVVRSLAKELAEQANLAVLVAFAQNNFYYTGLSKLFAQPEFADSGAVVNISMMLDALDEMLERLYETAGEEVTILIGSENPFSSQCSLLLTRTSVGSAEDGVMALLGPTRMFYNRNCGLLDETKQLLESSFTQIT